MKIIKKYSNYIISFISLLCLLCFLFLPICGYQINNNIDYPASGIYLTFGMKDNGWIIYKFNIVGLLLILLFLGCIVVPFFIKENNKLIIIITIVLSLITSILFFIFSLTVNHYSEYVKEIFIALPFNYIGASLMTLNSLFIIYFKLIKDKEK